MVGKQAWRTHTLSQPRASPLTRKAQDGSAAKPARVPPPLSSPATLAPGVGQDMVSTGPRAAPAAGGGGRGAESRRGGGGTSRGGGSEEGGRPRTQRAPNGGGERPRSQINPAGSRTTSRLDPAARRPVIGPEASSGAANERPPLSRRGRRAVES
uniref:Uncharacterized protein n=1 Tax=Rangifer tarandus platyrhynchus TaxID=3082113 RepID=A0ACB0FE77_RANTA|nr:unnamed protein product [Rangifer tarandus platyrhynchus]